MERKPFEIVAECEMAGFPSGADIERTRERIDEARRLRPAIVRAAVNPPAVVRDRCYVLPARFVVWAEDGRAATRAVENLLEAAGVRCRTVLPSGRALTETVAPPPSEKKAVSSRACGKAVAPARSRGAKARRPTRRRGGGKPGKRGKDRPARPG